MSSQSSAARSGFSARSRRLLLGLLACAVAFVLALIPSTTLADPSCTDSWTGAASDGLWQTAGNWSTEAVPSSSDVACIGPGTTVHLTGGVNHASVLLDDEGTLQISGGSLELTSTGAPSAVGTLALSGGSLSGPAAVDVVNSLNWTGGMMTGSGSTSLLAPATGTIDPGSESSLS
jgi:antigen 43